MRKAFLFLFFALLGFSLSLFVFWGIFFPKDFFSPTKKLFLVEKNQSVFQIAQNLEREGLIKNKIFFLFYLFLKGEQKRLKAGKYYLNSSMAIPEIAQKIVLGQTFKIKVTIPEGYNLKQIEKILFEKKVIKEPLSQFKVKDFKDEFGFLREVPPENSLEGFLFPETYWFDPETEAKEVMRIFLKTFEKKAKEIFAQSQKQEKNFYEILIMASLIEKEVFNTESCPSCKNLVSGILWKRLKNQIPLQVDATITYLTGKKTTKISSQDLQIESPYNTYKYLGLPPSPICNPGLESLLAALEPQPSAYWYYLTTSEGKVIFTKTFEEHRSAKAKYLK